MKGSCMLSPSDPFFECPSFVGDEGLLHALLRPHKRRVDAAPDDAHLRAHAHAAAAHLANVRPPRLPRGQPTRATATEGDAAVAAAAASGAARAHGLAREAALRLPLRAADRVHCERTRAETAPRHSKFLPALHLAVDGIPTPRLPCSPSAALLSLRGGTRRIERSHALR